MKLNELFVRESYLGGVSVWGDLHQGFRSNSKNGVWFMRGRIHLDFL